MKPVITDEPKSFYSLSVRNIFVLSQLSSIHSKLNFKIVAIEQSDRSDVFVFILLASADHIISQDKSVL